MFFFAGLRLFRFAQYAFAAAAIARRAIRLRGCGYFASLNTPSLPAYLLCKYGRLGAAMFSLRCEHTPRFFRYFAQLRRWLRRSGGGNVRRYAPLRFQASRLASASNYRKKRILFYFLPVCLRQIRQAFFSIFCAVPNPRRRRACAQRADHRFFE